ncbi:MAG: dicarboxylate/amino acid:cation symporter [Planctomycetota bacterium]|jgi:Na+/H+-dicarboxylate symporter
MKLHWQVLLSMILAVAAGLLLQSTTAAPSYTGATWSAVPGGLQLTAARGPAAEGGYSVGDMPKLAVGDVVVALIEDRGDPGASRVALSAPEQVDERIAQMEPGAALWLERQAGDLVSIKLGLDPGSARAKWIAPFAFIADIFMSLLKMLIVPIVLSSIVAGVIGVGAMGNLRRLGTKTFAYYVSTSLVAILVGQVLVSVIRPGSGAELGLSEAPAGVEKLSLIEIFTRMVPQNVPKAMISNGDMLQVIFFALLFGTFAIKAGAPHTERLRDLFNSFFSVMLAMAEGILKLLPFGVFALLIKVVAQTGFSVFEPLLVYMFTVALALVVHCCVTLPTLLKTLGGVSPRRWFRAMSPALMTAFSTSSSSMTLPITMETVEKRGKVSNKVTSFTLPLGATINMDGTALYECIGVIFLAQYYATATGFELTLGVQAMVVVMALMASVGAAGIPSAGLVMMLTILSSIGLPLEGAALLLAVDRPLDMLRTVTNVWSDSCGAAIIARTEGEAGPLTAGD